MGKWDGWRGIKGFPNYQINSDGDIRVRATWLKLKEQQSKKGAWYYQLTDANGHQTKRSYLPLLYQAWPELLEAWKEIPGHPGYLIDREGKVMGTKLYQELPMMTNNRTFTYNLHVWGSGGAKKRFDLLEFDWTVFEDYKNLKYYKLAQQRKRTARKEKAKWRPIPMLSTHEVSSDGRIRRIGEYRLLKIKEFFSIEHPGVLFIKVKTPTAVIHIRYENIMAAAWPELQKVAA